MVVGNQQKLIENQQLEYQQQQSMINEMKREYKEQSEVDFPKEYHFGIGSALNQPMVSSKAFTFPIFIFFIYFQWFNINRT